MNKVYVIKPNEELVAKAKKLLGVEYFDKYQYFKSLNDMFNEIMEYRDITFKEATEYLSNHYPLIQSVSIQLDTSIERVIEEILKKQQSIFSIKETEEIHYENK